ncbi:3-deoxy-D-manno-octulosonic acid transferase [Alteromonas sp. BMJM2]|uniref:3-deoxy-D-manno-octulosonic acid transferase n=1 Tax=Alteromonas sp. BMJM2 TaxID=2954241 RepID=UPI0022B4C86B|nr:3-deoxy-D-manno-octulosonic acid transferase [Alteromonas sp. BMJM2]
MSAEKRGCGKPTLVDELCRWLYSLLLLLLLPLAIAKLAGKKRDQHSLYQHGKFERFGIVPTPPSHNGYLIHCVSVGEVVAASCVIKQLLIDEPHTSITVTTTTATGSARVRDIFGDRVNHFYLPFDISLFMLMMLKRIRPKAVLVTEVELWPNMVHMCWRREIPVVVINARMTDRSARRYQKISRVFHPMLNKVSHVCAQGEGDYRNYLALGLPKQKLTLTNNIKFDQVSSVSTVSPNFMGLENYDGPILVAGSTHASEEEAIIEAAKRLWKAHPTLMVIIVPRHPERFDTVAELLESHDIAFTRSSLANTLETNKKVILLDEMGRLNNAYSVGTIAFVGGSIADRGGHNALEPAAFAMPILMGPNTYNNPVICQHLTDRGALQIASNAQDIAQACEAWLSSETLRQKAGSAGNQVLRENSGALSKTLACVARIL